LAKHSIPVVPHAPYSPDLAPCDFFLFPRLKSTLISRRRGDTTKYDTAVADHSQTSLPEKWKDRWNRCIQSGGSYFEGGNFE
jgi:hypothetical protein